MATPRKIPVVPPWERLPKVVGEGISKIQLNPVSAITRSESKALIQQWVANISMLAVLFIVVIGGIAGIRRTLPVQLDAAVNLKHSVYGVVGSVDATHNTFTLIYRSSDDPKVAAAGSWQWSVILPPGEKTSATDRVLLACSATSDLGRVTSDTSTTSCTNILKPGMSVLVEYYLIFPGTTSMMAKTIIGQIPR